jgi:hypothetical protein
MTTNSGKYLLPFGTIIVLLNILMIAFLFLYSEGYLSLDLNNNGEVVSAPVSGSTTN